MIRTTVLAASMILAAGTVTGDKVRLQGCVLKIFCKSQIWTRLQSDCGTGAAARLRSARDKMRS